MLTPYCGLIFCGECCVSARLSLRLLPIGNRIARVTDEKVDGANTAGKVRLSKTCLTTGGPAHAYHVDHALLDCV
jgi:hypothetical protein